MSSGSSNGQPAVASAESGYILPMPQIAHPFHSDTLYRRILEWYIPQDILAAVTPELAQFADEAVSDKIKEWNCNAEKQQPYFKTHDAWGRRYDADKLITSEGWKNLRTWGASNGIVAIGYEDRFGNYKRIVQHAKSYLFAPVSGLTSCPLSMTDGAARLLAPYLPSLHPSHPFHEVYDRLTRRNDAWTSGQWMTERPGGSDVQNTETWATYSPLQSKTGPHGRLDEGDYLVSGFKFFSSATDANVAVLLAKTESGHLSAFLAPLSKSVTDASGKEKMVTNGIRIHRLKNKMGTKQLPTAELELKNVRAHLIGTLDHGVASISPILNVTRSYAFIGSIAGWRRCLSLAKAFAKARTVFNAPLWAVPLHLRTLAEQELKLRGAQHLAFFTTALVSFTENGFPDVPPTYAPLPQRGNEAAVVLRVLTATTKAVVSKNTVTAIQECMEAMGGTGYIDEPDEPENVARALRDANVNAIWEGTTNVLSSEVVRFLLKGQNLVTFDAWMSRALSTVKDKDFRKALERSWQSLHKRLSSYEGSLAEALGNGRRIMFSIAWIAMGLLLARDSQRDNDKLAAEAARRWILNGEGGVGEWLLPDVGRVDEKARFQEGDERARWDCLLVWGEELPEGFRAPQQTPMQAKI